MPANAAVQQFIQAQLVAGKSIEEIRTALAAQGWDTTVINDSLTAAQSGTPLPPSTPIVTQEGADTSGGMTALTIVLLWLISPIGVIVMWTSTNWSKTVKWIITVLFLILPIVAVIIVFIAIAMIAVNPQEQFERAQDMSPQYEINGLTDGIDRAKDLSVQNDTQQIMNAIQRYSAVNKVYPTNIDELVAANELDSSFADGVRPTATFTLNATKDGRTCELTVAVEGAEPTIAYCNDDRYQ